MGLGRFILKRTLKSAKKSAKHGLLGHDSPDTLFDVASGVLGLVGGGMVMHNANEIINEAKRRMDETGYAAQGSASYNNTYANAALARIALCYYIAKADGAISNDEQLELDTVISEVTNSNDFPQSFRNEVSAIAASTSNSFIDVEKYLNKVNPETLVSFFDEMKKVAKSDNAISMQEQKALYVFETYLTGKTGRTFEKEASTFDMTCKNCGAAMSLDAATSQIICPFCGSRKGVEL